MGNKPRALQPWTSWKDACTHLMDRWGPVQFREARLACSPDIHGQAQAARIRKLAREAKSALRQAKQINELVLAINAFDPDEDLQFRRALIAVLRAKEPSPAPPSPAPSEGQGVMPSPMMVRPLASMLVEVATHLANDVEAHAKQLLPTWGWGRALVDTPEAMPELERLQVAKKLREWSARAGLRLTGTDAAHFAIAIELEKPVGPMHDRETRRKAWEQRLRRDKGKRQGRLALAEGKPPDWVYAQLRQIVMVGEANAEVASGKLGAAYEWVKSAGLLHLLDDPEQERGIAVGVPRNAKPGNS